jgi:hypothetical protein
MSDQKTDIRVWVRVQVVGDTNLSSATKIRNPGNDVDDLRDAVKAKMPNALKHCDSVHLKVYRNATDYNNRANGQAAPLDPRTRLEANEYKGDEYIVVVPARKQGGGGGQGKMVCAFLDHGHFLWFVSCYFSFSVPLR